MIQPRYQVQFDPQNPDHVREYAYFLTVGRWKGSCPFVLEEPFLSVPHMIERKLALQCIEQVASTIPA